jgi:hypothetical protein
MAAISRIAAIVGVIALIVVVAASFLVEAGTAVTILRYGTWAVGILGALGLVTGLLAGADGRASAIASVVVLLLIAAFIFYSTPQDASGTPAEPAPASGG